MDNKKKEIHDALINLSFSEQQIQSVINTADSVEQAMELIIAMQDNNLHQYQQTGLFTNINDIPFDIDFSGIKGPLEINDNRRYKMICVVRMDLKMGIGKIAAQTGHAVLGAYKQLLQHPQGKEVLTRWEESGQAKVVVKCESKQEFLELEDKAKQCGLNTHIVQDAGRTQVEPGSLTVCAIGPADSEQLDKVTGHLKLL